MEKSEKSFWEYPCLDIDEDSKQIKGGLWVVW